MPNNVQLLITTASTKYMSVTPPVLVLCTNKNPMRPVELLQSPDPQFKVHCLTLLHVVSRLTLDP